MQFFVFCQSDLVLEKNADGYRVPEEMPAEIKPWTTVMNVDGSKACRISSPLTGDTRYEMVPLRQSYYHLSKGDYLKAGKCHELLYWDQNTKYCGVCGGQMKFDTDISKKCEHCGKEVWPQLAIAIIVLIRKGNEVLLVQARSFRDNHYGLVAGFVETGETLEEAVRREVREETQLEISNLQYFGSQPWPYPCGLMVGFTADYAGGDIHLQRSELAKGAWFDKDHLPHIPEKLSIARQLIDNWLAEDQQENTEKQ